MLEACEITMDREGLFSVFISKVQRTCSKKGKACIASFKGVLLHPFLNAYNWPIFLKFRQFLKVAFCSLKQSYKTKARTVWNKVHKPKQ